MSYTPPAHGACDFNFTLSYTPPVHGSVNFNFISEIIYTYVPSGGMTFGGAAGWKQIKLYIPSGGITFAGAALTNGSRTTTYTPSGGIQFGGTGPFSKLFVVTYTPSGGLVFDGTANLGRVKVVAVSGGFILNGEGNPFKTFVYNYPGPNPFVFGKDPRQRIHWRR
jgi:hypothetical protein